MHIMILPKPGKDLSLCGSYAPISLLNMDAKLYTKVLAITLLLHDTAMGLLGPNRFNPW